MADDIALIIDPFSHHFFNDALFTPSATRFAGENIMAPWTYLHEWFVSRGIRVHTADRLVHGEVRAKTNIFMSFGLQKHYPAVAHRRDVILSAFFAFESPVVEPHLYEGLEKVQKHFRRVFTFTDAKWFEPVLRAPLRSQEFRIPSPLDTFPEQIWARRDRKFLVMVNRNSLPAAPWNELYTERMRAVEFFARTQDIDLYGLGWDGPSFQMGKSILPGTVRKARTWLIKQCQRVRTPPLLEAARKVYHGPVDSKLDVMGNYTFCLCFENLVLPGWITEKIFDCFAAGTIPIYWGAPDIENFIPGNCFIDMRKFSDYEALKKHLKSMDEDQIRQYRENGRAYLQSEMFRPFRKESFTELVAKIVEEDAGISIPR